MKTSQAHWRPSSLHRQSIGEGIHALVLDAYYGRMDSSPSRAHIVPRVVLPCLTLHHSAVQTRFFENLVQLQVNEQSAESELRNIFSHLSKCQL